MDDPQLSYTYGPARYAKGMISVRCIPDGTGWKTLASTIISNISGVRYSNREGSYILSPNKFKLFESAIEATRLRREAIAEQGGPSLMQTKITPTYGKNALLGCYMCHAWLRGKVFIVTAVDVNGKELAWRSTSDPTEVGTIVKEFAGVA